MSDLEQPYEAAFQRALVVRHPAPGVLEASGADRLDLLHRMSTNSVVELRAGQAEFTVLTDALGRIVDLITVVQGPIHAFLITTPGQDSAVLDWLLGYVFFNDDVHLRALHQPLSLWGIYGPQAGPELGRLLDPERDLNWEDEAELRAAWRTTRPLEGWQLLLGPRPTLAAQRIWPKSAGSEPVQGAYAALRIEAGLPLAGQDFSREMTPLEAGLEFALSSSKGCYIGQEVIARMQSRDQAPRRLWGVRLSGAAPQGVDLHAHGARVGTLTSAALSPKHGWIGLARIEARQLPEDGHVALADRSAEGNLVHLPFH